MNVKERKTRGSDQESSKLEPTTPDNEEGIQRNFKREDKAGRIGRRNIKAKQVIQKRRRLKFGCQGIVPSWGRWSRPSKQEDDPVTVLVRKEKDAGKGSGRAGKEGSSNLGEHQKKQTSKSGSLTWGCVPLLPSTSWKGGEKQNRGETLTRGQRESESRAKTC